MDIGTTSFKAFLGCFSIMTAISRSPVKEPIIIALNFGTPIVIDPMGDPER
jgi:hypothetical protein